jgi:hypothetical protein
MHSIPRHHGVLTGPATLVHCWALHCARKAVRRDAARLRPQRVRRRGCRGWSFSSIPGSKALRRDAKGLTDRSEMRGSFRAVEVWGVCALPLVWRRAPRDFCGPFFLAHK